jgi:diguanylate cyclase (GGDEF)-like protein/PAS domain S-box-containing protein
MAGQLKSRSISPGFGRKQLKQITEDAVQSKKKFPASEDSVEKLKRVEEELSLLKKSIETISSGITIADANGTIVYTNPAEAKMHGYLVSELLGKNVNVFTTRRRGCPPGKKKMLGWKEWVREAMDVRKDGTTFPVRLKSRPVRYTKDKLAYIITISEDVTELKKIEEALLRAHEGLEQRVRERTRELESELRERKVAEGRVRLLAKFIENTNEAVVITGVSGKILDVNDAFVKSTGYTKEEVTGKKAPIFASSRRNGGFSRNIWEPLLRDGNWQGEIWGKKKNGELYPQWLSVSSVRNDDGEIAWYVAISTDISQIKETEGRLERLAHYDPLTNLPNRGLLKDRLRQSISQAQRHSRMTAVIFLDLDRFKEVNDTLGHGVGDQLLHAVAQRLKTHIREGDTIARLGGDEFAVILQDVESADRAARVAQHFLTCLSDPFMLDGHEIFVTASVGITMCPFDALDTETLLKNADTAMYSAKSNGRNNFQFFTSEMNLKILEKIDLESKLRHALDNRELILHFQPQVEVSTGKIIGLETLVRWTHPELGIVAPSKFIPVAEDTGLIIPIGEWILEEACKFNRGLENGGNRLNIAVNLSARQFHKQELSDTIELILRRSGFDPKHLELEITESIIMQDVDATIITLNKLKDLGIRLSVDDFGTGYSSLNYLKRFPIDALKIDRSFVTDITTSRDGSSVVSAIIALAHSLNLEVIAEGVETEEQLEFLREKGCDLVQGFYFSKPLPYKEIKRLLKKGLLSPQEKAPKAGRAQGRRRGQ